MKIHAGWWRVYTCVARVGLLYQFINIILIQITKKALKAYEYYEKTMMQIWKYPTFSFSKLKGKHEILLYIKYAKNNNSFKYQYFLDLKSTKII
jgi:hypothetical protein